MNPFDCIIIGSGLAGATACLHLNSNYNVLIITPSTLMNSSSARAQGGIAASLSLQDQEGHIQDTIKTAHHLCRTPIVQQIIKRSPALIDWLVKKGVTFDKTEDNNNWHCIKEGGHTKARVLHIKDHTGRAIQEQLLDHVRQRPFTLIREYTQVVKLIMNDEGCCSGVIAVNTNGTTNVFYAREVILASGGVGQLYGRTSNPSTSTGVGISLAYEAGCMITNVEFIQFHPTCFYPKSGQNPFLITEALRGAGAILRRSDGSAFMSEYSKYADLAARDIVSRAVFHENKIASVYLDASHISSNQLRSEFPSIINFCRTQGIMIERTPIPIEPAMHYMCGGIDVRLDGHTGIDGLSAIGEVAHSGLHGANRLASNSLLECLVMGYQCAQRLNSHCRPIRISPLVVKLQDVEEPTIKLDFFWKKMQTVLWQEGGIYRTEKGLEHALSVVQELKSAVQAYSRPDFLMFFHSAQTAELIIHAALSRRHSLGTHYREDYPKGPTDLIESQQHQTWTTPRFSTLQNFNNSSTASG